MANARQRRFVEEYLKDCNATQAALRAGYSPRTVRQQGHRLLTNVAIADAVADGLTELSERAAVTTELVVAGFS